MRQIKKVIFGIILVALGVLWALNTLEIVHDFTIFFDGWWTLFIIVPSFLGVLFDDDKWGNLIALSIGALLLLNAQEIIDMDMFWKLIVPIIVVLIGLKMIFGGWGNRTFAKKIETIKSKNGKDNGGATAIFSGAELNVNGEVFNGATLTAIFGGVECNLRNAIIDKDCVIDVTTVFGGVDILIPENVNVRTNVASIFGGVDNRTRACTNESAPTIYVKGACIFGGVDIH